MDYPMAYETITQADRERAASQITVPDEGAATEHPNVVSPQARALAARDRILAGEADDHPSVQAAAFQRLYPSGYRTPPRSRKAPIRSGLPVLRLSVPVRAESGPPSRNRFDAFFESLVNCGYAPEMRDRGDSIWVGDVCVAEFLGGDFYVYPAAFARYGTPEPAVSAIDMAEPPAD